MSFSGNLSIYSPTFWLFTVLISLWLIQKFFKTILFYKHLRKIPSPKGIPFFGNIHLIWLKPDELFADLRSVRKTYGSITKYQIGFGITVILSNPNDIEMVISQMKHLTKSATYIPLNNWLKEGLLLSDGSKWQERRKLLTPTFHFTILNQFTKTFIEESNKLAIDIKKKLNEPVDVLSLVTNFTLQSICETAMGTKLDEHKSGENYKDSIYSLGSLIINRCITPWQHSDFLHKFTSNYWKSRSLLNYLHKFTSNVIKNRESSFNVLEVIEKEKQIESRKRLAMLDLLLIAKMITKDIDDDGIKEEVDTFMFEGHDTTATSLTFTLMLLANYKEIQDSVYQEICNILNESDRDFTMEDLNEMKYLERVIKESLRLYPSVPLIGRTLTEDIKRTRTGYYIPKGCSVLINIYDLHRDSNYYTDPERFDPDRFLPDNVTGKHPYCYIPFSAGPRNCIGQKFAMLEMKAAIATILRNFELFPIDTPQTITLQTDIILRSVKPIFVKFQQRVE
nr:cytochrome P450 4C1-like [Onthophagus taurus]